MVKVILLIGLFSGFLYCAIADDAVVVEQTLLGEWLLDVERSDDLKQVAASIKSAMKESRRSGKRLRGMRPSSQSGRGGRGAKRQKNIKRSEAMAALNHDERIIIRQVGNSLSISRGATELSTGKSMVFIDGEPFVQERSGRAIAWRGQWEGEQFITRVISDRGEVTRRYSVDPATDLLYVTSQLPAAGNKAVDFVAVYRRSSKEG